MKLHTDEIWVVFEFEDLHTLSAHIASDEVQASSLELIDIIRVDLVTMTMALVYSQGSRV